MTRTHLAFASTIVIVLLSMPASRCAAQVPFFGPPGIFDPEISTVQSGVILDAQAVVSADRKYVTMTTRFQLADLLALREFAFQTGGGPGGQVGAAAAQGVGRAGAAAVGNVNGFGAADGGAAPPGAARGSAGRGAARYPAYRKSYPKPGETGVSEADHSGSILDKPGMTLIGRIQPNPAAGGELSHR